ncbi:DNA polymerase III subunit gamma/tau [Candidatus Saccharibacteria bacterium oral taxon 488]|nr:DNA polymerase III subunit gamma/tau [Candidatus Saccharibacteria bacterium oral taxon 488]QLF51810.1 DNA polymerase III subunit gamma/tau [Candidatus Saccharibacteria bacterium oral taxon 488]
MSQALYRKYRSRSLDEVLGQDHVTNILRRALEQGKIAHAYLLTGPRGVGKTSVARILAHEINQLPYDEDASHLDIIEIDAASNNGVDDIRALREKAQVAPVSAPKKIYIIDEVHMLSRPAFNALLKTLEEPPAHVVFILATTDADKLPATILSRVQQFFFRPISVDVMARQLMAIAEKEGFAIEADAARLIAERSRGGFRDGISMLDQLSALASAGKPLSASDVAQYLGLSAAETLENLLELYQQHDAPEALNLLGELEKTGTDPIVLSHQLLSLLRAHLHQRPELITLVKQLIEVDHHPHPDLKLLTIFMDNGEQVTDTSPELISPLIASPKTTAKPPATISKSPVEAPESPAATPEAPAPAAQPAENSPKTIPKQEQTNDSADKTAADAAPAGSQPAPDSPPDSTATDIDWDKIIALAKEQSFAIATLLQHCSRRRDGNTLTLYVGNAFNKKKLDDSKNRPLIATIVQQVAGTELDIATIGQKAPPKDAELAKIAELMGGGEEVNLEELS